MRYAYGITTVPSRLEQLLPRTLDSLRLAGFPEPRLFIDGDCSANERERYRNLPVTIRDTPVGIWGNWYLTLWELFLREPRAQRYIIFQDDLIAYRNLRTYLDTCKLPKNAYFNLYCWPENLKHAAGRTGWFPGPEWGRGKGAVALMFDWHAMEKLLASPHFVSSTHSPCKNHTYHDGRISRAMKDAGYHEYVHTPSLVQHTGKEESTWKNGASDAECFRGEDFDAMELIGEMAGCSRQLTG